MLDVRSGRDATKDKSCTINCARNVGDCKGVDTQQLSCAQWKWLDKELSKKSEIKIIGSGIQVLPPTDQDS